MEANLAVYNNEKEAAITWLRCVLLNTIQVAPVVKPEKKLVTDLMKALPNWLLISWAESLDIDYLGGYRIYPDMAEDVKKGNANNIIEEYMGKQGITNTARDLRQLVDNVTKLNKASNLPTDSDVIEKQIASLAWAYCTREGIEFASVADRVLKTKTGHNDNVLANYTVVLASGDNSGIEAVSAVISWAPKYNDWVDNRLNEAKRFLGIDKPILRINYVERSPQWDALWRNIITGG